MCQNCVSINSCTCECEDEYLMVIQNGKGEIEEYLCDICRHVILGEKNAIGL
ncbi:MAG: hypothetical protein QXL94_01100 [Candidatus Parvarchaeum sp.]